MDPPSLGAVQLPRTCWGMLNQEAVRPARPALQGGAGTGPTSSGSREGHLSSCRGRTHSSPRKGLAPHPVHGACYSVSDPGYAIARCSVEADICPATWAQRSAAPYPRSHSQQALGPGQEPRLSSLSQCPFYGTPKLSPHIPTPMPLGFPSRLTAHPSTDLHSEDASPFKRAQPGPFSPPSAFLLLLLPSHPACLPPLKSLGEQVLF